jgi:hypothetical protein
MEVELGQLTENFLVTLVGEKGDAGVLVAPNTVHNDNGYEHAGSDHRIDLAEFTGVDTAADDSSHEFLATSDYLVSVEPGEVGELVQLTEDEAVNSDERRGANERPVASHEREELAGGRAGDIGFFSPLDRGDGRLPDHFPEELFLVGEVEVDGAFGDSGAFSNILESGVGEATFAENLEGGLYDLLGPICGASTPFWYS